MQKEEKQFEREELLADIAGLYYEEGQTQAEIAMVMGKTRSAISRMLTEARQKGIVEIQVHHPLRFDKALEKELVARFPLINAHVLKGQSNSDVETISKHLGRGASSIFNSLFKSNQTIGIAWGTTVSAAIDAYAGKDLLNTSVVQLVGILGSTNHRYSGQALVERLATKIKGLGVYLYTPYIVQNKETAEILLRDQSINEAISLGKNCDIALLGIGSTKPDFCSLFKGGYISQSDLDTLHKAKAVGDVAGHYYDINGDLVDTEFQHRLMSISSNDLRKIPIRLGMAGHPMKAEAIMGAIRGGSINVLMTDQKTATKILELSN